MIAKIRRICNDNSVFDLTWYFAELMCLVEELSISEAG